MSKEKQQSSVTTPLTTSPSTACISDTGGNGEEDTITLFAPFESQKPARSLFYSSEQDVENNDSRAGHAKSREAEFQASESQATPGSAAVIFRRLKAAVSGGGSSSSLSPSVSVPNKPSPLARISDPPQNQGGKETNRNSNQSLTSDRYQKGQRSSVSPTPSAGSVSSSNVEPATTGDPKMFRNPKSSVNVEHSLEPRISLTSYSDPHVRAARQQPFMGGVAGGGVARPQAQAVNKSEMLKRFGSIADNQVQVSSDCGVGDICKVDH